MNIHFLSVRGYLFCWLLKLLFKISLGPNCQIGEFLDSTEVLSTYRSSLVLKNVKETFRSVWIRHCARTLIVHSFAVSVLKVLSAVTSSAFKKYLTWKYSFEIC